MNLPATLTRARITDPKGLVAIGIGLGLVKPAPESNTKRLWRVKYYNPDWYKQHQLERRQKQNEAMRRLRKLRSEIKQHLEEAMPRNPPFGHRNKAATGKTCFKCGHTAWGHRDGIWLCRAHLRGTYGQGKPKLKIKLF